MMTDSTPQHRQMSRGEALDYAIESTDIAIKKRPQRGHFHHGRAKLLLLRGSYCEAERAELEALTLAPSLAPGYRVLAHARRQRGNHDAALEAIQKYVRLRPNAADGRHILGIIQQESGNTVAAIQAFQMALELRHDHADAARRLTQLKRASRLYYFFSSRPTISRILKSTFAMRTFVKYIGNIMRFLQSSAKK
jgi:tetratricopeptide (TPR) repeat protein